MKKNLLILTGIAVASALVVSGVAITNNVNFDVAGSGITRTIELTRSDFGEADIEGSIARPENGASFDFDGLYFLDEQDIDFDGAYSTSGNFLSSSTSSGGLSSIRGAGWTSITFVDLIVTGTPYIYGVPSGDITIDDNQATYSLIPTDPTQYTNSFKVCASKDTDEICCSKIIITYACSYFGDYSYESTTNIHDVIYSDESRDFRLGIGENQRVDHVYFDNDEIEDYIQDGNAVEIDRSLVTDTDSHHLIEILTLEGVSYTGYISASSDTLHDLSWARNAFGYSAVKVINSLADWEETFGFDGTNTSALNSAEVYIYLNTDLDFSGVENLLPIGFNPAYNGGRLYSQGVVPFKGTLLGGGHTLRGVSMNIELDDQDGHAYSWIGLFAQLSGDWLRIYDLNFDNLSVSSNNCYASGALAGGYADHNNPRGAISNVNATNSSVCQANGLGAILGKAWGFGLSNCSFNEGFSGLTDVEH